MELAQWSRFFAALLLLAFASACARTGVPSSDNPFRNGDVYRYVPVDQDHVRVLADGELLYSY